MINSVIVCLFLLHLELSYLLLMRQPLFMYGCIRLVLFFFHLQVGPVAVASLQGVGDGVRIPLFQNL